DLLLNAGQSEPLEVIRVVLTMRAERMTGVVHTSDDRRVGMRHLAHQKIRGLHALGRQDVENFVAVRRDWPIIESEHDLMIFERQRLRVLHAADALEVAWIDRENPAGTQLVRIARAP